mmetsp:Transcript_40999/g.112772  ORF Transcript_40999/g.112772 Transcript_40999/m.112772 type:complete len:489 (+) Transcript_40999:67-1533(+)
MPEEQIPLLEDAEGMDAPNSTWTAMEAAAKICVAEQKLLVVGGDENYDALDSCRATKEFIEEVGASEETTPLLVNGQKEDMPSGTDAEEARAETCEKAAAPELRHIAEELAAENGDSSQNENPGTKSNGSEGDDVDAVEKLGFSARHMAFLERRRQKRKLQKPSQPRKMSSSTVDTHGFLSNLPEVQADVAFRLSFTVMGVVAVRVVKAACSDDVARSMNVPSSPSTNVGPQDYRSLCRVPFLPACGNTLGGVDRNANSSEAPQLAKLMFTPMGFTLDIPACRTRFEALSSVLVYVLCIDGPTDFAQQLRCYEDVVTEMHHRHKPLRQARFVLLVRTCGTPLDAEVAQERHSADEESGLAQQPEAQTCKTWYDRLAEFELVEENLVKYGPVDLQDASGIHAVFATIASLRITRSGQSGGDESDGSQDSDPPPHYEAERDPDWEDPNDGTAYGADIFADFSQGDESFTLSEERSGFKFSWMSDIERGAA